MNNSAVEFDKFKSFLCEQFKVDADAPIISCTVTLTSDVLHDQIHDETFCWFTTTEENFGDVHIKETASLNKALVHLDFVTKFQTYKAGPDGASLKIAGTSRGKMGNYTVKIVPTGKASKSDIG